MYAGRPGGLTRPGCASPTDPVDDAEAEVVMLGTIGRCRAKPLCRLSWATERRLKDAQLRRHALAGTHRAIHSPAVASVALGVDLDRPPEVTPVEIRPERVQEHHLGVGRLPQQEVAGPLLSR
jgi:hypothetical protein